MGSALEGDLRYFQPSEVLQFLRLAQATGRLELERPGEHAELLLEDGQPVQAHTSRGSVRVGEILLHRRVLSHESLDQALSEQRRRPSERLGALLLDAGAPEPEVAYAVREALRRILYGLMLWDRGSFKFVPGERAARDDLRPDLDLDQIILEGLRRADEVTAAT